MIEENVKTHRALNCGRLNGSDEAETMAMDTEKGLIGLETIKLMVEDVLKETGYSDVRPAKMDLNDFLCLLAAFNAKGIHFA